ncbi:uncharacterized protein ATNIH1004_002093 [Aspergillus tanneri]|uniref:Uncharacterized protein n=1 Tax=Aspergillus tanneri TaxID=1220188 RepID=A0A5M9MQN0_9EURO|nr:uncharacterized protein ATNIH1004_002093 [Aspergillus tanneri]KAA8649422.1 hypothetical protein ATNIH1004_002093 [Aspergillus tanneri]
MNYHELCGDSRKNQSLMLDAIANAYYGISSQGTVKQRRDFVTGHMRLGRWCWRLAGTVGVGVSLTFGDKLMTLMVNHKFTNAQIDALVTYVSNTHPGTVRLLHRLESIAKPLILGELPMDLIEEIQNNRSSILGECELSHAITDDETALVSQLRERPWTVIDSNFLAIKKIAEFLRGL